MYNIIMAMYVFVEQYKHSKCHSQLARMEILESLYIKILVSRYFII